MSNSDLRFLILRSIGNFLFLFAIFGVIATFGPSLYYELQFRIIQARGIQFEVANSSELGKLIERQKRVGSQVGFADLLTASKDQLLYPPDTEFSILIPKIGASAKIYANVDPSDQSLFLPVLQNGVAHAQGTLFPGLKGNIYIFAHSADNFWNAGRYNAIFYLLKDLEIGDEIVIFYQGQRHNYFVTDSRVVEAEDVSFITHAQTGVEQLILQTCWPPGTTWKRQLIFAKPK